MLNLLINTEIVIRLCNKCILISLFHDAALPWSFLSNVSIYYSYKDNSVNAETIKVLETETESQRVIDLTPGDETETFQPRLVFELSVKVAYPVYSHSLLDDQFGRFFAE